MQLSREELVKAYGAMATIRRFEERVQEEFSKGGIPGFVHLYAGEEASAVGVCSHLRDEDYIASTHRGHGHSIAKGCDPVLMMQELFAKKGGLCGGKGGSMHIADLDRGMLGANGIVGGGPPLVVGAALSAKTLGRGTVAVSFTGDGGSNQGTTFEAMNMAVVLKLPAIFVFENNQYGEGTGFAYAVGSHDIAGRARVSACLRSRSTATISRCTRRRARPSSVPAAAGARARSRSTPAAFTATTPATPSSIAARTRSSATRGTRLPEELPPPGRRGGAARNRGARHGRERGRGADRPGRRDRPRGVAAKEADLLTDVYVSY